MVKLKAPVKTQTKVRSTVRVPSGMLRKISDDMQKRGYNKKQQSKWIEDALSELLELPQYTDLIAEEFISAGTTTSINVTLTSEIDMQIQKTISEVMQNEQVEKDKSAVIRVAIIQKLLSSSGRALRLDK
ncbi:hypothetical protein [Alteromonas gilva]|uniref:Ribbon-helix-helix protein CopG domain-containing protein n=1 Tax=Alteromonas gilva TaxID=2987522 RepID=A0ABT5L8Q8_9ALTE|nr:hypothetical protein [Alteromonas gilva]MDC8832991.1 hypothetical protein [Alteromonas gilva]